MFKGHPVLGAISGFMFGLFLPIALFFWGVIPLHSPAFWIAPLVGIVFGMIMAAWAPFGSGSETSAASTTAPTPAAPPPASPPPLTEADMNEASGTTMEQDAIDDGGGDGSDQT